MGTFSLTILVILQYQDNSRAKYFADPIAITLVIASIGRESRGVVKEFFKGAGGRFKWVLSKRFAPISFLTLFIGNEFKN